MKIAVIILNWNREKDTIECLESVTKLKLKKSWHVEVIVVDNASKESSFKSVKASLKRLFRKKRSSTSKLIRNNENLGFAAGNNVGINYALENNFDLVMLLNNDTEVDKGLLQGLIDTALQFPKAGAIAPKIYFAKGFEFHKDKYKSKDLGKVIWYAGGYMDWSNVYGSNRGVDEVDDGKFMEIEPTDFVTGACVLLRREALEQIGGFDEKYFMYLEDADLSLRLKKNDWLVLYTPNAHLWHKVAQSSGIGSELNDYFITRNRMLFGMRYAPIRTRFALYRESLKLYWSGREWQRIGIKDFYLRNFGRGSWKSGKRREVKGEVDN